MRILFAEDEPLSRRLMSSRLTSWGYDVQAAKDGDEAYQVLAGPNPPQLALLDWEMPGMDGPDICKAIRAMRERDPDRPYTYILLLTNRSDVKDIISGLESGADDYIKKGSPDQELRFRLQSGRRIVELQDNLLKAWKEQERLATHDTLTGIWNRARIMTSLRKYLEEGDPAHGVGVAILDLDHFKRINDTYGHDAGDAVLKEAARRFKDSIRDQDHIGRYGGEEFLAVFSHCDTDGAVAVSERLRTQICATPCIFGSLSIPISTSIGTVAARARSCSAEMLVKAADEALYQAKANGRNRVVLATPPGGNVVPLQKLRLA